MHEIHLFLNKHLRYGYKDNKSKTDIGQMNREKHT